MRWTLTLVLSFLMILLVTELGPQNYWWSIVAGLLTVGALIVMITTLGTGRRE